MNSEPIRSQQHPVLGRVERAILDELSRSGGLTHRERLVRIAYPELEREPAGSAHASAASERRRARAEAATTRAIRSLETKGLLHRQRNERTGRVLIVTAGVEDVPEWEAMARAEEDLAAHCRKLSERWTNLARRAKSRAGRIRAERSWESSEEERVEDLDLVSRLDQGPA